MHDEATSLSGRYSAQVTGLEEFKGDTLCFHHRGNVSHGRCRYDGCRLSKTSRGERTSVRTLIIDSFRFIRKTTYSVAFKDGPSTLVFGVQRQLLIHHARPAVI